MKMEQKNGGQNSEEDIKSKSGTGCDLVVKIAA